MGSRPPFSLEGCFNLSELSLDMKSIKSCIVTTSTDILLTLDPIQRSRLEFVRLTTRCTYQWLGEGYRSGFAQTWGNLDTVLSGLANVATKRRGKGLTFILVSTGEHKEGCISFGRKWLPEMLPRFRELGSLCLNHAQRRLLPVDDDGRVRFYGLNCMKED